MGRKNIEVIFIASAKIKNKHAKIIFALLDVFKNWKKIKININ